MNIKNKVKTLSAYFSWAIRLYRFGKKTAYLLGTPIHENIGDAAIALAEIDFLKNNGCDCVVEVTTSDMWEYSKCIGKLLPANSDVYLLGGGNMGDQYELEEKLRQKMISNLSKQNITIFPQTIHYNNTPKANELKQESVVLYNHHKNLTIIARETTSYRIMRELYPDINIILTPDIVLSLHAEFEKGQRQGILLCFRNDSEKQITEQDIDSLRHNLESFNEPIHEISMMAECMISPDIRKEIVEQQLSRFASAKLIITDRLHGMVFAALVGTPCIVFNNYNHKVCGTYDWIKALPYIRLAENYRSAIEYVSELINMNDQTFDYSLLSEYYDQIVELIKK